VGRVPKVSSWTSAILWLSSFTKSHPSGCFAILSINFVIALLLTPGLVWTCCNSQLLLQHLKSSTEPGHEPGEQQSSWVSLIVRKSGYWWTGWENLAQHFCRSLWGLHPPSLPNLLLLLLGIYCVSKNTYLRAEIFQVFAQWLICLRGLPCCAMWETFLTLLLRPYLFSLCLSHYNILCHLVHLSFCVVFLEHNIHPMERFFVSPSDPVFRVSW
jgi:hypothetical protein